MTFNCEYCKKTFGTKSNLKVHQEKTKFCIKLREEQKNNQFICEYCNKSFVTKGNLKVHQEKTKFCIKLREQINEAKKEIFECEYCLKNLSCKFRLEQHLEVCKVKQKLLFVKFEEKLKLCEIEKENYILQIKKLEEQNYILQTQLKDLFQTAIEKPSVVNNTSNNSNNKMIDNRTFNMIPFTLNEENLRKTLEEKFTENHLINGQKGVAQFCVEHVLVSEDNKYMLKCTDPSRKIFVYVDQEGKIHKDINAFKLTRIISEPVIDASYKMINELPDKYPDDMDRVDFATNKFVEIANIKVDNNEFVKNLIPSLIKT